MVWPVTVTDFKSYFPREFPYGLGMESVTSADITRALGEAAMGLWNEGLWNTDKEKATAYLYLAAHFLELDRKRIKGGVGAGAISSKSVGSVSLNYALPASFTDNPMFSPYMRTSYGQDYLAMIYPRVTGNVIIVSGQPMGILSGE